MKHKIVFPVLAAAAILLALELGNVAPWKHDAKHAAPRSVAGDASRHQAATATNAVLPAAADARTILNSSERHRQWVNVSAGSADIRAYIVYPERANKAPVVVLAADKQGASDWIRAVADRVAADGFIAIVPDVLSGLGPRGGDADAFPNDAAVAAALDRMGPAEIARRTNAVRDYATSLPSATGQSAALNFEPGRIEAEVAAPVAGQGAAAFSGRDEAYLQAIAFVTKQTGDHPIGGVNPDVPEDHSAHFGMMMAQTAQTSPTSRPPGRGFPKEAQYPANRYNAIGTLHDTKMRHEFVDLPMGDLKLHTWVEYPEGEGKAPIVIVMEHAPGLDDWQRALADQLAVEGFIAIAPDLNSGMGPNGGNYDSFIDADHVFRSVARLNETDIFNRYKTAWEWGMKLARANGKSASIGFCMGGGNSFRFAAGIPQLNAAVSYYGNPSRNFDYSKVHAPVLAFYGVEDARVTATLPATEAAMKQAGKPFEFYNYPHVTHGFAEYQNLGDNENATKDAWPKTIAFLKKYTM